ncbi:Transposase (plasmid) [Phaeobacter gallaeciensis]|uniref:Transposase n=1 Tax=Phaeobacter gallaeciensis TaxID=60890 RepID=A0AAD0ED86_9RHOB|nr:Transposase [Phaeobacter gallaeciensis DSM 26640]ATE94803.1 Transposase [Phaeobacter gallaeciensis]ATE99075.1 Transposase [Phaeobacter gallaeciensis]ATF03467.1 Transposase [Phaeobacter gallaeciensis]ATF07847.1 Transposase [Phaeobacter gallaeciensis]
MADFVHVKTHPKCRHLFTRWRPNQVRGIFQISDDARIKAISSGIEEISRTEKDSANIMTIPGVGPLISTAIVAAIGKGEVFDRGRDFTAWVGLVPPQFSTAKGLSLVGSANAATAI